jgi:hypothetical protein
MPTTHPKTPADRLRWRSAELLPPPKTPPAPPHRPPRTHPPLGAASCRAAREPPSASRARPRQPRRLPPTQPRPNPLPVSAFPRRFKPASGPGRHRANASPAGFFSPEKTKPVSFLICEPPARGTSRRMTAAKSLPAGHFRGAGRPERVVIRTTLLVTAAVGRQRHCPHAQRACTIVASVNIRVGCCATKRTSQRTTAKLRSFAAVSWK